MTAPDSLTDEFDAGAPRYDLLTALNPGYHAALRTAARSALARVPDGGLVLDLGCGSGLSTRALFDVAPGPMGALRVLGIDASEGMLAQARRKRWPEGVRFLRAYAQDLPEVLAEEQTGPADAILAAYLLRNIPAAQRDSALAAMHDALVPGGRLVLQEYSVAGRPLARAVWTVVCLGIVLPLAVVLRGSPRLYVYLWRSVLAMDSVAAIRRRLLAAGFDDVRLTPASGWQRGILHTFTATRGDR